MSHICKNSLNTNNTEYMLRDGSVKGCFITPEESEEITKKEGLKISNLNPETDTERKDSSSKSYITIICSKEADPKFNRLQLRTEPPTFIELQPGENKLTIEDYPALKFGFKQIDDNDDDEHLYLSEIESIIPSENCQNVIKVDLSHFDGSEMESMDYMFHFMQGIEMLTFGKMETPKLKSAERAFWGVGNIQDNEPILDLDLSGLDFSNVTNASDMFSDAIIRSLNLSDCNFENINGRGIFGETNVKHLILDNCKFKDVYDLDAWSDYRGLMEVSLKGWDIEDCRDLIIALERGRSGFIDFLPTARYILDPIYNYHIRKDSDENVTCEILAK